MSIQTDWEPTRVKAKERDSDLCTPKTPVQRNFDVAFDPTTEKHGHNVGGVFSYFAPGVPWAALGLALTALILLGGTTFVLVTRLLGNELKHMHYDYSVPGLKTGSGSGHSIGLNTFYFSKGNSCSSNTIPSYIPDIFKFGHEKCLRHSTKAPFYGRIFEKVK